MKKCEQHHPTRLVADAANLELNASKTFGSVGNILDIVKFATASIPPAIRTSFATLRRAPTVSGPIDTEFCATRIAWNNTPTPLYLLLLA